VAIPSVLVNGHLFLTPADTVATYRAISRNLCNFLHKSASCVEDARQGALQHVHPCQA
jgi:hypothetical protein